MIDAHLDRIEFLQTVELFADINQNDLALVSNDFRERKYPKGRTIFNQEDNSHQFFVIKDGLVRIFHLSLGAKKQQ